MIASIVSAQNFQGTSINLFVFFVVSDTTSLEVPAESQLSESATLSIFMAHEYLSTTLHLVLSKFQFRCANWFKPQNCFNNWTKRLQINEVEMTTGVETQLFFELVFVI